MAELLDRYQRLKGPERESAPGVLSDSSYQDELAALLYVIQSARVVMVTSYGG